MSNQPHAASPRRSTATDDDGGGGDDREVEVAVVSDVRRARCLRNGLVLANLVAWIVILMGLKIFFLS